MSAPNTDELLAAIRNLPIAERTRLIERAAKEAAEDTPTLPVASDAVAPSLLGLMADEPELVDEVSELAYEQRRSARMRAIDE